mgnify:CR=1 FL=1
MGFAMTDTKFPIVLKWLAGILLVSAAWCGLAVAAGLIIDYSSRQYSYFYGYPLVLRLEGTFGSVMLQCARSVPLFWALWGVIVLCGLGLGWLELARGRRCAAGYLSVTFAMSLAYWLFLLIWLIPN